MNILLFPFIFLFLFFVAAAGFGLWAYNSREDYRNNTDQKIDAAVKVAKQEESVTKDKEHAEQDKQPLKTYSGPEQYGSLKVSYPKTWSGYINDTGSSQPLDAYFQPDVVPNISNDKSTFALRVEIVSTSYASIVNQMADDVKNAKITATAYSFPRVSGVVGIRYDGALDTPKTFTGSLVVVPIRDKTLEVWTESPIYASDFNNNILPNITFSP